MLKNLSKKLVYCALLAFCFGSPIYALDTIGEDFGDYDEDYRPAGEDAYIFEEGEFAEEPMPTYNQQKEELYKNLLISLITARKFLENDKEVPAQILENIDALAGALNQEV